MPYGRDRHLAFKFTKATIEHDPEADTYRREIERRWGRAPCCHLRLPSWTARPARPSKYASGHGQTPRASSSVAHQLSSATTPGGCHTDDHARSVRHVRAASPASARPALIACSARWRKPKTSCRTRILAGMRPTTTSVAEPRAFLMTTTTRLCLDVLKSARHARGAMLGRGCRASDKHGRLAPDAPDRARRRSVGGSSAGSGAVIAYLSVRCSSCTMSSTICSRKRRVRSNATKRRAGNWPLRTRAQVRAVRLRGVQPRSEVDDVKHRELLAASCAHHGLATWTP